MKKPVLILISLIYIIAIAVVGFLGISVRVFNPVTFVTDIQLTFDEKLSKIDNPTDGVDYAYRILGSTQTTFNITAKVLPNEATNKDCVIEKRDESTKYTYETNFTGEYTIGTFTCQPAESGGVYLIELKVKPTDGNKSLYKIVDIYVFNF